jgi:hypothetical protein
LMIVRLSIITNFGIVLYLSRLLLSAYRYGDCERFKGLSTESSSSNDDGDSGISNNEDSSTVFLVTKKFLTQIDVKVMLTVLVVKLRI